MQRSQKVAVYFGPNPYSPDPVVVAEVTLDDITIAQSRHIIDEVTAFTQDLFTVEPSPDCLNDAERLVSFISRWALKVLTLQSGYLNACGFRAAGAAGTESFSIWVGHHRPNPSIAALALAISVCEFAATGKLDKKQMRAQLEDFWKMVNAAHPDTSTRLLVEGAKALDIPAKQAWNLPQHWLFGWGAQNLATFKGASNHDGVVSNHVMGNKRYSKALVHSLGLPAPQDVAVSRLEDLEQAIGQIGFPCVIKPPDSGQGTGVTTGLETAEGVETAFRQAQQFTRQPIMLEQHVRGDDHRLVLIDGKVVLALRRVPPSVTGDGTKTVRELVEAFNHDRKPEAIFEIDKLVTTPLNDKLVEHLGTQGLTLNDVLEAEREITLSKSIYVAYGATPEDVTERVHPDVRIAAETIARSLGVHTAAFEYMSPDISKSWKGGNGAFIELNLTPGLNFRVGWTMEKLASLVLGPNVGRIPLDAVVVPDVGIEKVEMHFAQLPGREGTGWASVNVARAGLLDLDVSSHNAWSGVESLLGNRTIEHAFAIIPSNHLITFGFPVDRADRIWNCDPDLPAQWQDVLKGACSTPVKNVSLEQFLELPLPTGMSE